jgi:predicted nucleic acid-binding protein
MDTNTVIDYLGNKIPEASAVKLDMIPPVVSVMTRIEVLGWFNATQEQIDKLTSYLNIAFIYPLDETIILKTISLRQQYRMKLPDAIIAATALSHNLTLMSRNLSDFRAIGGLSVIDPHSF